MRSVAENKLLVLAVVVAAAALLVCWRRDGRVRHAMEKQRPDVAAGLEKRIGAVHWEDVTLWEALCRLQSLTAARMRWIRAGDSVAIAGEVPQTDAADWGRKIQLNASNIRLDTALDLLMRQAEGAFPGQATYDVDADGSILVGCEADMPRVISVYDVEEFEPPQGTRARLPNSLFPAPCPPADRVAGFVEDTVATESWMDNGGTSASWRACGGKLIIVQSRRNHRQIEFLFEQLRRLHARIGDLPDFDDAPVFGGPL